MGRITVAPEQLERLAEQYRRSGEELRAVGQQARSALAGLPWEQRYRSDVDGRADAAVRQAGLLAGRLEALGRALSETAALFRTADSGPVQVEGAVAYCRAADALKPHLQEWARLGAPIDKLAMLIMLGQFPLLALERGVNQIRANPKWYSMTGLDRVDEVLRQHVTPYLPAATVAATKLVALTATGKLLDLGPRVPFGRASGVNGLTAGKGEAYVTLDDAKVKLDALHYGTTLLPGVKAEAGLGHFEGTAKYKLSTKDPKLELRAKGSVVHGEVSGEAKLMRGLSVGTGASGDVLGAEGVAKVSKEGVEVGGWVYGAQGEVHGKIKVFSWEMKLGVKGCAACAGGGAKIDWAGGKGEIGLATLVGGRIFWDLSSNDADKRQKPTA